MVHTGTDVAHMKELQESLKHPTSEVGPIVGRERLRETNSGAYGEESIGQSWGLHTVEGHSIWISGGHVDISQDILPP